MITNNISIGTSVLDAYIQYNRIYRIDLFVIKEVPYLLALHTVSYVVRRSNRVIGGDVEDVGVE